jgi:anti-sigma28 factor (negative regulator of flagellin synthesis)
MRITDPYRVTLASASGVRRRRKVDGVVETDNTAPSTDQVLFSERSADVRKARGLALDAPEVRIALVDSISSQISRGQYSVTGSDVAPKLIQDHLVIARA